MLLLYRTYVHTYFREKARSSTLVHLPKYFLFFRYQADKFFRFESNVSSFNDFEQSLWINSISSNHTNVYFLINQSVNESVFPVIKINLLELNDVNELQILPFVYQWSHRLLPPCFSRYFKFTSCVHSYSTRQSCNRKLYVASVNIYYPIWPTF